jgi:hypothetical protein
MSDEGVDGLTPCCGCGIKNQITDNWAKDKIGQGVETRIDWCGVPALSTGKVIGYEWLGDGWDVIIEWDNLVYSAEYIEAPIRDWFTEHDYETTLMEIEKEPAE